MPAEQLDAHDDGGVGRLGGGGEESDHPHSCEEIDRCVQEPREGISERGSNEE